MIGLEQKVAELHFYPNEVIFFLNHVIFGVLNH